MVASLLPSSTTMISQLVATLGRIFTAASTVPLMLSSSLNAGKITDIVAHGLEISSRSREDFMLGWWITNSAVVKLFRTRFQIPYVPTSQHRDQSKIGIASQMVLLIRNSSLPRNRILFIKYIVRAALDRANLTHRKNFTTACFRKQGVTPPRQKRNRKMPKAKK